MTDNRSLLHNDYLGFLARLIMGGIFIYASLDKIFDQAQFARIIYNYHLLPGSLINIAAIIMPWVELICGCALLAGVYRGGSSLVLNGLLIIFMIAIAINLYRGVDLECGCFTVSSKAKSNALSLLLRDLGLLIIGLYAYFNKSPKFSLMKPKS